MASSGAAFSQFSDRAQSFWESVPCNLCKTTNYRVIFEPYSDVQLDKILRVYSAMGNFSPTQHLVQCQQCGSKFASPRPQEDLILRTFAEMQDAYYLSQTRQHFKRSKIQRNIVEKYLTTGRILDIGTAGGFFLKEMKEFGWEVFGIEPCKYLADFGNRTFNANILALPLEQGPNYRQTMDVITLWDVIGYTLDPMYVLLRCNRYLSDRGYVFLTYPRISHWLAKVLKEQYGRIFSSQFFYFDKALIKAMLGMSGFELESYFPYSEPLSVQDILYRWGKQKPNSRASFKEITSLLPLNKIPLPSVSLFDLVVARKIRSA